MDTDKRMRTPFLVVLVSGILILVFSVYDLMNINSFNTPGFFMPYAPPLVTIVISLISGVIVLFGAVLILKGVKVKIISLLVLLFSIIHFLNNTGSMIFPIGSVIGFIGGILGLYYSMKSGKAIAPNVQVNESAK